MKQTKKDRPLYQRIVIDIAGFGLMIASFLLGWLPGPGGIPLFLAGLGLLALNHEWAESLLKNFEKKREVFTDKYLMSSPRTSRIIDFVSTAATVIGLWLAFTQMHLVYKGVGLAITSISLIVILSNQKRFERIAKMLKKHKK
jgi:hypothetical protein